VKKKPDIGVNSIVQASLNNMQHTGLVLYDGHFRGLGQLPCGISEAILYTVITIDLDEQGDEKDGDK